jgi:hypothetical protein
MKSDDTNRSAHKSETTFSSQEARSAQKSKQKIAADKVTLSPDEAAKYREAIGTDDLDFLNGIIRQLGGALSRDGVVDEDQLNFTVSIIRGVKSRGRAEIMLAAQMAVVNDVMMNFAQHLATATSFEEIETFGNIFNKLARTYATLMEVQQRCYPPGRH